MASEPQGSYMSGLRLVAADLRPWPFLNSGFAFPRCADLGDIDSRLLVRVFVVLGWLLQTLTAIPLTFGKRVPASTTVRGLSNLFWSAERGT